MTSDQTIEQEIQAKGKTAPRVTPAELQANITSEHYFTAMDGILGTSRQGTGLNVVDTVQNDQGVNTVPDVTSLLTFCVLPSSTVHARFPTGFPIKSMTYV